MQDYVWEEFLCLHKIAGIPTYTDIAVGNALDFSKQWVHDQNDSEGTEGPKI